MWKNAYQHVDQGHIRVLADQFTVNVVKCVQFEWNRLISRQWSIIVLLGSRAADGGQETFSSQ